MKDELTFLINALQIGLISSEEIITWADNEIEKSQYPSDILIELSLTSNAFDIPSLLLTLGGSPKIADIEFLALISGGYFKNRISVSKSVSLLMKRFCFNEDTEIQDIQEEIYIIDVELEWNKSKAIKRLEVFLKKYTPIFVEKFESYFN
ncbi:MAG: hypothetical protein MI749_04605 [Desulfovibrionales bacterium]|nr:hypothetical protein [Desulfovibrionales bacterium]